MTRESEYKYLEVATEEPIAIIRLNRPEVLNAFNSEMHREIQGAFDDLESDEKVHVAVLCGAGRAFCSGSDIRHVREFKGPDIRRYVKLDIATKHRVATCSKPVIAALHGHVAGGGFELALACDIRFVADDVLFSLPEVTLGTVAGTGLHRLKQIVGLGIAKEWVLTGRRIDAEEAYRTGLANRILSPDKLLDETREFVRDLADRSPTALALAKVALDPEPPAVDGMTGTYHMLASQACHDDPTYQRRSQDFAARKKSRA